MTAARSSPPSEHRRDDPRAEGHRGRAGGHPDRSEVAARVDRIRWQPVHLRVVQQEEEGSRTADAVVVVREVELGLLLPGLLQLRKAVLGALAELVELAELDRIRGTGLRTCRLLVVLEAVVAERALPGSAVPLALVQDSERARRDAVP